MELYARDLEERGRAKATIGRRLSTIAGFYRYAAEGGLIEHSPAVHVRRPRLDYESHAVGLDRNELGAFLVAAGLSSAQDHALASLLALNGLRISEALGADIADLGLERGHRTLVVHRKGGKTVTIPLAPRTARAVDPAMGERLDGPLSVDASGARLRRDAAGWCAVWPGGPGSASASAPTASGTRSSPPSTPGRRCATCRRRRRTPIPAPPCATTGPASPWTATPRTS
jgi:integrase/recombinase XerD